MTSATDAATAMFLRTVNRPLPVLREPTPATRPAIGPDVSALWTLAGHLRQHTLDHLDGYLTAAGAAVVRAGGTVHFADDAADVRRIVTALGTCAVAATVAAGEAGLTAGGGPAFVVAETGQACVVGVADDWTAAAAVAVVVGLEAVVPRPADLAVVLKLLPSDPAGHTVVVGSDAGRIVHLIWLDNGRSDLLGCEHRAALRCVGCGACTAVCPVYRAADVQPDGLWAGPIGAIVRAAVAEPGTAAAALPHTSTLCGACADVCPVRIDLTGLLVGLRPRSPARVRSLRWWGWVVRSPWRYRWATRLARWRLRRRPRGPWPRAVPRRSFQEQWQRRRPTR